MKNLLIALTVAASVIVPSVADAGCCNSGSGSYRLPSYSSSKSYSIDYIRVYNKSKQLIYVQGSNGIEESLGKGKGVMIPIEVASDGTIKFLGIDSKATGWKDFRVDYKPSHSSVLYVHHINGKLRPYWRD